MALWPVGRPLGGLESGVVGWTPRGTGTGAVLMTVAGPFGRVGPATVRRRPR